MYRRHPGNFNADQFCLAVSFINTPIKHSFSYTVKRSATQIRQTAPKKKPRPIRMMMMMMKKMRTMLMVEPHKKATQIRKKRACPVELRNEAIADVRIHSHQQTVFQWTNQCRNKVMKTA